MVGWSAASPPQGVGGVEEEEEFLYFFVQSETQRNGPKFDLKECVLQTFLAVLPPWVGW